MSLSVFYLKVFKNIVSVTLAIALINFKLHTYYKYTLPFLGTDVDVRCAKLFLLKRVVINNPLLMITTPKVIPERKIILTYNSGITYLPNWLL